MEWSETGIQRHLLPELSCIGWRDCLLHDLHECLPPIFHIRNITWLEAASKNEPDFSGKWLPKMDILHINNRMQISLIETSRAIGWEGKLCFLSCVFFKSPSTKHIAWIFALVCKLKKAALAVKFCLFQSVSKYPPTYVSSPICPSSLSSVVLYFNGISVQETWLQVRNCLQ